MLRAAPGDLYEADVNSGSIFKFRPDGSGKTAVLTQLKTPTCLAFDVRGTLFVGDSGTNSIYKFTRDGIRSTFATGLNDPEGLAFDGVGNLYVTEALAGKVSKFTPDGTKTTFASNLTQPFALAFDSSGNLFVSDPPVHRILKFTPAGTLTTFASGLNDPLGITFDNSDNLYVIDSVNGGPHLLYKFTASGVRSTFATLPNLCFNIAYDGLGGFFVGNTANNTIIQVNSDGSESTLVTGLSGPQGLAVEPVIPAPGIVYVGDGGAIKVVNATGRKSTFTANGLLQQPYPLAFDSKGNLFAAQSSGIIKITPAGTQSTYASSTSPVTSLAIDSADNVFYGDAKTIYKVTSSGTKTPFGTTTDQVLGMAVDALDNLFVSTLSSSNVGSILKFTSAGAQSVFATGIGRAYGLVFNASGDLYVAQYGGTILKYTSNGTQSTYSSESGLWLYLGFDAAGNLYASQSGSIFKYAPNGFKITFYSGNALGVAIEKPTGRPLNISTRLRVQGGDNVLIAGFIVSGPDPRSILVRGIGPSLTNFGVPGALQDPMLELHKDNNTLATNDNWKINDSTGGSQQAAVQFTGLQPSDDRESVIIAGVVPGAYTAILRGKGGSAGVGSVEVYDYNHDQTFSISRLANISTRGFVDLGDNVMIAGFIINDGDGYAKVVIRALGPSLTAFGVPNALPNPTLELHNGSGTLIDQNDDWKSNQAAIQATGFAPSHDLESAIVATLPAGGYTAIVKGVGGTTGVGLVEVYNLK